MAWFAGRGFVPPECGAGFSLPHITRIKKREPKLPF